MISEEIKVELDWHSCPGVLTEQMLLVLFTVAVLLYGYHTGSIAGGAKIKNVFEPITKLDPISELQQHSARLQSRYHEGCCYRCLMGQQLAA